jgi:peptidoglycan/xylan/chitin deacetylase (PgdA/CDA1 family)
MWSFMKIYACFFLLISSLFLVFSCGGSRTSTSSPAPAPVLPTNPAPQNSPKIINAAPTNGAALISPQQPIHISFDIPLAEDSIQGAFEISSEHPGKVSYLSQGNTIVYTPTADFPSASAITVTVNESLMSAANTALQNSYTFTFYTQGEPSELTTNGTVEVSILDLSLNNSASKTDFTALSQALDIAGVSYSVINSMEELTTQEVLFLTSYLSASTLSNSEQIALRGYVQSGGIAIARNLTAPSLFDLFGIASIEESRFRNRIIWDVESTDIALRFGENIEERSLSLGQVSNEEQIRSSGYTLSTGDTLAAYEDDTNAIVSHTFGLGETFLLGVSFSDLTLRNQLNLDYSAQRGNFNDVETTSDQFMLFLRAVLESRLSHFVFKHTSPKNSTSTLMISHDIDSQSGANMLADFAALESDNDIDATYNVTTRYIDDAIDGDFYSINIDTYQALAGAGHEIASHSVGHFTDFDHEEIVPKGMAGNTQDNYRPSNDGTITSNATVYGELEVSKDLLQENVGVTVTTFRSGHLLWNQYQAEVLEELDYRYDSSLGAHGSLSHFPFRMSYEKKVSSKLSSIFVFPISASDSISGEDSAFNVAKRWSRILEVNRSNNAPTVLLVHPNRDYKLRELEQFIRMIPNDTVTRTIGQFGDFWSARDQVSLAYEVLDNTLVITMDSEFIQLHEDFSIVVNQGMALHDVRIADANGELLAYEAHLLADNKLVLHTLSVE